MICIATSRIWIRTANNNGSGKIDLRSNLSSYTCHICKGVLRYVVSDGLSGYQTSEWMNEWMKE